MTLIDDLSSCAHAAARSLAEGIDDPGRVTMAEAMRATLKLDSATRDHLAATMLLEDARSLIRAHVRCAEKASESPTPAPDRPRKVGSRDLYQGRYRHGSTAERDGAAIRGCDCEHCQKAIEVDNRHHSDLMDKLSALVSSYADGLRMEWNEELLAASFAFNSKGETCTWGEATVAHHEDRIAMLQKATASTIETAAKHRKAVDAIRSAGASCLSDVVRIDAKAA